jgi:glycosyltransferase involved in cell wall biosynthesis
MMTSPRVIAVIPAYNEEKTVGRVVAEVKKQVAEVIVVDDRSSDATARAAEGSGAMVLTRTGDRGYDASLNDGFAEAARRGANIIMSIDDDGEHDAADIPRILAPILEGRADIVAGQRPHTRHWSEAIFSLYTRSRFGVRDPLCGLKAYDRAVYDAVGFFDEHRSIGTELMLRGIRRGFRIVLVPITLHQRADISRFYTLNIRGNLRILKALFHMLFV